MRLKFIFESVTLFAVLNDTPTSRELIKALPAESAIHTWGEEVYFGLPVKTTLEGDAKQVVDPGTVCFWVEGSSLSQFLLVQRLSPRLANVGWCPELTSWANWKVIPSFSRKSVRASALELNGSIDLTTFFIRLSNRRGFVIFHPLIFPFNSQKSS